ncbi:hypothetical protein BC827DRAFT_219488 [Russula dissimulans]|nr:hypothetical protein BC827DRAFT_219488 [Russula dissimulans]
MTAPLLAKLQVSFFHQLTFHLPRLVQFLNIAENLRFHSATLQFLGNMVSVWVYSHENAGIYALHMNVGCRGLDWQVASTAQIFSVLRSAFSTLESLTLEYLRYFVSSEWREADRTQWHDLLRPLSNVKTLRVSSGLISESSCSLQSEDGASPVDLLPELKVLSYSYRREFDDAFTTFIDARRIAGCPVAVVRR